MKNEFGIFGEIDKVLLAENELFTSVEIAEESNVDLSKPVAIKDGKFINSDNGVIMKEIFNMSEEDLEKFKKGASARCT